ncbi:MAG: tRNA (5-methylaminomethyl-2-thiouridine)(34)-methyltransferase MnmD [Flavobacteriaceae bacterium]|jgi:tRNA U34 5-methylaminomethyl-2-thiouridine-forming methyltransferase MnmC|nr:tRNA (5-methylaminomethyl-2-thiouridine)(34)-methyltransferase MnmD [Flavobacteriaceae bacterium]
MLKRHIIATSEGTKTIQIPEWNECYHSQHGILQEAFHVFINHGLNNMDFPEITVLEMGFGTGLNAFLTLNKALEKDIKIKYHTLEKYPVSREEWEELQYWELFDENESKAHYLSLHEAEWDKPVEINKNFQLTKYKTDFFELKNLQISDVDLVYYDAFGARVQPEFWEEEIFKQVYNTMSTGALLTTYSSKGSARRAMQSAGFEVEKKEGPKGKREMVNAWKK